MVVISLKTDSEIYVNESTQALKASSHLCFLPRAALIFILLFKGVCVGGTYDIPVALWLCHLHAIHIFKKQQNNTLA